MSNFDPILALAIFVVGIVLGVVCTLLFNRLHTGAASPGKVKKEMDEYQNQVEAHFEETSKRFKSLSDQYQDLYEHLSVGATSLCRPESVSIELQSPQKLAVANKSVVDSRSSQKPTPAVDKSLDKELSQKKPSNDSLNAKAASKGGKTPAKQAEVNKTNSSKQRAQPTAKK